MTGDDADFLRRAGKDRLDSFAFDDSEQGGDVVRIAGEGNGVSAFNLVQTECERVRVSGDDPVAVTHEQQRMEDLMPNGAAAYAGDQDRGLIDHTS